MNNRYSLKNEVLLLLLLTVAGLAKAQTHEFAPVGAEWYYERLYREGWNLTGVTYDRFRSLRTVDINGWECKEIELFQNLDCDGLVNPHTEKTYITQEESRIYEVKDGQRLLLYDFDKNPGDSWYAPKYDVEVYVIDTTTIILEDGSSRKMLQTFTFDDNLYINNIIEGIGMDRSVFPFYDWEGPPPCMHDEIRCYLENGIQLIVSETECDYEILVVDNHEGTSVVSMNTVVEDVLHIDFAETTESLKYIKIHDMTGKVIYMNETMDNMLDIDFFDKSAGVYLVQTIIGPQVINNKIVKR